MPCSCKKTSAPKTAYVQPSSGQVKYFSNLVTEAVQASDSYDFRASTAPQELCLNCIAKHLGLAYCFLQQAYPDNLISVGQLLCAAEHCKNTQEPSFQYFRQLALRVLRNPADKELGKQLAKALQGLIEEGALPAAQDSTFDASPLQEFLLRLLLAYSLLFVELLYEKVNTPWAVAHLAFASASYFRTTRDLKMYEQMRQFWKMVQAMQPQDQTYIKVRDQLWGYISSYYRQYRQPLKGQK